MNPIPRDAVITLLQEKTSSGQISDHLLFTKCTNAFFGPKSQQTNALYEPSEITNLTLASSLVF
jgi:hypothetical protein